MLRRTPRVEVCVEQASHLASLSAAMTAPTDAGLSTVPSKHESGSDADLKLDIGRRACLSNGHEFGSGEQATK
jgi:hypothetical protein